MPTYAAFGIISQQSKDEYPQRMFLPFGSGVFGTSLAVESAFIADADTFIVEAFGVGADLFYRSGRFYIPVFTDIKVVACSVESPSAMADI